MSSPQSYTPRPGRVNIFFGIARKPRQLPIRSALRRCGPRAAALPISRGFRSGVCEGIHRRVRNESCFRAPRYPRESGDALRNALEPAVAKDILLLSDAHRSYPPCAAALGVRHEALNATAGERVRGPLHIQTVNSRHGQFKDFLRGFRGVATKYLDSYLRWFHLAVLPPTPSPRTCLAAAIGNPMHTNQ